MNSVVKAENEKIAAVDFATATETAADGQKRPRSRRPKGSAGADPPGRGEAEAIRLVNEAAERYFVGNAQVLRKLEAVEKLQRTRRWSCRRTRSSSTDRELAGVLPLKKG